MDSKACADGKGVRVVSNKSPDPHWTLACKGY